MMIDMFTSVLSAMKLYCAHTWKYRSNDCTKDTFLDEKAWSPHGACMTHFY